jgi:hypothetical protein
VFDGHSILRVRPVLERDVRTHGLEVVEVLAVDLRERLGAPLLREVAAAERRSLAAVVPALEGRDETGRRRSGREETFSSDIVSV